MRGLSSRSHGRLTAGCHAVVMTLTSLRSTHPATTCISDPALPEVATLLARGCPAPLTAVVDSVGGVLTAAQARTVTWWPGSSISVIYEVDVDGGAMDGRHELAAVAGAVRDGAVTVAAADESVSVWRLPHDPALPGMAAALDPVRVRDLMVELGAGDRPVQTERRAYRPGRRSVVAVRGGSHDIYLKITRPSRIRSLHERHRSLPSALPVPQSLGVDPRLGILALEAMPGHTLRRALEHPDIQLPPPGDIVAIAADLPPPSGTAETTSPVERLPRLAELLLAVAPAEERAIRHLVDGIGEDPVTERVPSHGDFYEAQLLTRDGRITGMLDVDTYGWGRPADDAATMLGHLAVWAAMSHQPGRVNGYASQLLRRWDAGLDPVDLRRRVAAVILGLATGPFRVQTAHWPADTAARIALATRWMESADRVGETDLMTGSASSHR